MGKTHSPRFLASVDAARALIEECDSAQLRAMMDDGDQLIVVDVREAHEYAAGHLEGAVHLRIKKNMVYIFKVGFVRLIKILIITSLIAQIN